MGVTNGVMMSEKHKRLLRRRRSMRQTPPPSLTVDMDRGLVLIGDAIKVKATYNEIRLLSALLRAGGKPVDKKTLLIESWNYDPAEANIVSQRSRAVEQVVMRIRKKLNAASPGAGGAVKTHRIRGINSGEGYYI